MSNVLYPTYKESRGTESPSIKLLADTLKAALVTTAYNAAHQYLSSVTVVGTPQTLANKAFTGAKLTSDPVDFGAVAGGSTCNVVLYKDTGVAGTSPLIGFFDTGTNLPIVTNGGIVTFTPDATNGWFTL